VSEVGVWTQPTVEKINTIYSTPQDSSIFSKLEVA